MSFFTKPYWQKNLSLIIVVSLLLLLTVIGFFGNERFFTLNNFANVFEQAAALAFVSLGQTLAILTAGIDLSVGSIVSAASQLTSGILNGSTDAIWWLFPAILLFAIFIGILNALFVIYLKIHPLIVTLGTGTIIQGLTLLYSRTPKGSIPIKLDFIAYGRFFGLSISTFVAVMCFIFFAIFLKYSFLGKSIYAVGNDYHGSILNGVKSSRVLMFVYGCSAFFAAVAGIYLAVRFGSGNSYAGTKYTLSSITPVIIGGTILSGGKGGVMGTLLGVFLLSLLNNLLNFMQVSTHYQLVIQGIIIIAAVSIYVDKSRLGR